MAEQTSKELVIELSLENSKLKSNLAEAQGQFGKAKKSIGGAISSIKLGWIAVAAAVTGAIAGIGRVVSETLEAERTQNKLITAMKNQGIYSKSLLKDYNDQASALQKVTTFENDQITVLQAQLTQFGLSGKSLKDVTKATLDLAQSQGMDLATAGTLVGKSISSNTNALGRYGITTITAKNATDRATQAVEGLNKVFGGQAEAAAQTFEGRLIQLTNTGKDFQESIGKGVILGLDPLLKRLQKFTGSEKGMKILGTTAKVIATIFIVLGNVVGQVVQNVINYGRLFGNVAETIGNAFKKLTEKDFKGAGEEIKEGFKNVKDVVIDTAMSFVNSGKDIAKGVSDLWNNVEEVVTNSNGKIQVETEQSADALLAALIKKQEEADALIKQSREKNESERIQNAIKTIDELVRIEGIGEDRIKALQLARYEFQKQLSSLRITNALETASQIEQGFTNIFNQIQSNEETKSENKKQRDLANLQKQFDDKIISEEEYTKRKDEIDTGYQKEAAKRKRAQAKADKASNIFSIIINTASAIMKGFKDLGPVGGLISAAVTGVIGATQLATVSAAPLPEIPTFASGGMIKGLNSSFNGESGMIGARNGESVLNQQATAMLGEDAINALNKGRSINPNVNITVNGGDPQNIVKTLNSYFKQYGTSARGVAV